MTRSSAAIAALFLVCSAARTAGQELEPRAYSPSPIGTTFLVVSATRSAGGVLTDPTLPIADVDAEAGVLGLAVGHVFRLAGKQALVLGLLPVTWADASGQVGEDRRSVSRRGLADPRVKLSVILRGSPAMTPAEFVKAPRRTVLGASFSVVPPAGQYDQTKLINLGANRWSFKPELGVSYPSGRWTIDAYAGVWFFTDNDTFYPVTSHREQNPIVALQGHVSYALARRAWLAFDGTLVLGWAIDSERCRQARLPAQHPSWRDPLSANSHPAIVESLLQCRCDNPLWRRFPHHHGGVADRAVLSGEPASARDHYEVSKNRHDPAGVGGAYVE